MGTAKSGGRGAPSSNKNTTAEGSKIRDRAEAALEAERFRFKEFFENLPMIVYNVSFDGRILYCNDLAVKTLGYRSKREIIGKPLFTTVYAPSSRRKAMVLFKKWKKEKKLRNEETQIITKRGEIRDVLLNVDTIYDKNGKPLYSLSAQLDITERKKAEESIIQLNRFLKTVSKINQTMVKEKDRQKILDEACRIIVEHGKMKMAWIGMADPETHEVHPVAQAGASREYLRNIKVTCGSAPSCKVPVGMAIKTGKHCIIEDLEKTKIYLPWIKQVRKLGFKSSAAFPIYIRGRAVGALGIHSTRTEIIKGKLVKLLDELAADIGYSLEAIEEREEREKAEREIRNLAKFPEENPSPVMRVSKKGILLYMNKTSKPIADDTHCFVGGRVHGKCHRWVKKAFGSRSIQNFEAEFGGRKFFFVVSPMEKEGYANIYATDVTERRKAEEALRESEENYRSIFENLYDVYYRTDMKGRITIISPSVTKYGYAPKELIGKDVLEVYSDPSERDGLLRLLKEKGAVTDYDLRLKRKSGEIVYISTTSRWVRDDKGKPIGIEGMLHDITGRRKSEEIVKNYAAKLEAEVTARTKLYLNEKDRAEALSAVKDEFIKNITHELKTPLSVIMGNLTLLKDMAPAGREREWSSMIDMLDRNSIRLSSSIDQILELSRIGATELRKERIYLKDMLDDVRREHSPMAEMKHLKFKVQSEPAVIFGDAHLLRLAMNNLVSNAIKFTSHGSVTLGLRATDGTISISVTDTGKGMSPDTQKKMFEKFFKADPSAPGTGIGLNIAKQIVEKHGGSINVKSKLGKGSTFEIVLLRGTEAKVKGEVKDGIKKKKGKHKKAAEETRLLLAGIAPKEWAR